MNPIQLLSMTLPATGKVRCPWTSVMLPVLLPFNVATMQSFRVKFNTVRFAYDGIPMIYGGGDLRPGSRLGKRPESSSLSLRMTISLSIWFQPNESQSTVNHVE